MKMIYLLLLGAWCCFNASAYAEVTNLNTLLIGSLIMGCCLLGATIGQYLKESKLAEETSHLYFFKLISSRLILYLIVLFIVFASKTLGWIQLPLRIFKLIIFSCFFCGLGVFFIAWLKSMVHKDKQAQ